MIVADEIFKRLFIWGVAAVAVVPRQHTDQTRLSIGGNLSHSFRKLLLCLVVINFLRFIMKDTSIKHQFQLIRDILGIAQQLGNSFLCFLSPYILQTWLVNFVNIGGRNGRRPGANLMPALYLSTALSILAAILSRTVNFNFWALRKIGNAISSYPVVKTLQIFNSVSTRGGSHEGRGTILSQSLLTVEGWYCIIQILGAIGFIFNRGTKQQQLQQQQEGTNGNYYYNQFDEIWSAFREASFVLDWTRILAHAVFINQLDEMYLTSPTSSSSSQSSSSSSNNDEGGMHTTSTTSETATTVEKNNTDLVPLLVRRHGGV